MEETRANSSSIIIATFKLMVTALIWASTFVLARIAVQEIGPLTLAGIRFFLTGLILVTYLKTQKFEFSSIKGQWMNMLALGILSFTIGNATVFFSLKYLPSTTVSLMMNFITPLVLLFSILWLKEIPGFIQYIGLIMALAGSVLYFSPQQIPMDNLGFLILLFGLFGFAGYTVLGRSLARDRKIHFLAQTAFPLLLGGGILLIIGLIIEGIPVISPRVWVILAWMIAVNTLLGYILYNQAIIHLTAIKINVILNLAPFFTAIIAWFLLGERISPQQVIAMLVIFAGTLLVQLKNNQTVKIKESPLED